MKICYLSDAGSAHTLKWSEFFLEKGYEVIVISLGDGEIPGAKVYSCEVEGFRSRSDINKLFIYYSQLSKIKAFIKKENPDIIHAHYATSYGLLASLLDIHPYILSIWGSDIYDFPKKSSLHEKLLRRNLKKADIILSTSEDMKKEVAQYTDKKVLVTPFGVDIDLFKPLEVERYPDFTVGIIKSFYPKYGITYLIEAFKMLIDKTGEKNAKLLLGGKGTQEQELRDLTKELGIEDNVKFLGFLNTQGVVEAFNKMDVAVFPSVLDSESFGVAAVEAQACEVPTIVSDVGGLPEATKPGYSSITVEPQNSEAIYEALLTLYEDENLRKQMAKNARQYVIDNYNIEDNFNVVDDIYKNLLNK